ncbi:unnamed protein product [Arabis nemorensis]|uniref:Reverse transcriptase domain-containing protein n=1 Tax=Arabis nemorensis TaxID=586526 RepID=A0A565C9G7_9BRAS|nr:unnamed protein product [Arabis nemorensis]
MMEADKNSPIILGMPFLKTARAVIDLQDMKVTLTNVTYDITTTPTVKSGDVPAMDDYGDPTNIPTLDKR